MVATNPFERMRGLLGRASLDPDEAMLFRPTGSIHMLFMRFAIDAVFIDREGIVLRVAEHLPPWRTASKRGARAVIELAAGECARRGVRVGERLELHPRTASDD